MSNIIEDNYKSLQFISGLTKTVSNLSPDRAILHLTEQIVSSLNLQGALLLIPNEKQNTTISFVKSLKENFDLPSIGQNFYKYCFSLLTKIEKHSLSKNISLLPLPSTENSKSFALPVVLSGKAVALLVLFNSISAKGFNSEHKNFLQIISSLIGNLIENFRLNNEIIQKNSRLSALYEISQQTESLIDFQNVYDSLGKVAKSFINFDVYKLYLLNQENKILEAKVSIGSEANLFKETIKIGDGPIGMAAKENRPYLTFTKAFNSVLILPVEVSGKLTGIVTIASKKPYAYRDEDIIGLRIIATQIASIDLIFKNLIQLRGVTERILESITSGVVIFDNQNEVTYSNSALAKILGTNISNGWSPFKNETSLPPPLITALKEVLLSNLTLESKRIVLSKEAPVKTVEISAFPFRSEEGKMLGTAFFIKDITQLIIMEEQLKRADRLSALGVLAAGIAHEIRNPLTGMKMIVQILETEFNENDSRREPLSIIQKEINRLEKIVGNLLDFARPGKAKSVTLSINTIIDACYLLIKNQLKKQNITFTKEISPHCPEITGDPDQLKQVFLNILTNAIQALKSGGNLSIKIYKENNFMVVTFTDTGTGIPAEKLQDIFNPFMTTKEDGTGLGLSMAQRIVEEHGGKIDVESIFGKGSCFKIYLPVSKGIKEIQ